MTIMNLVYNLWKIKNIKIAVTHQSNLESIIVTEYSDLNHLLNLKSKELIFLKYFPRLGSCIQYVMLDNFWGLIELSDLYK